MMRYMVRAMSLVELNAPLVLSARYAGLFFAKIYGILSFSVASH